MASKCIGFLCVLFYFGIIIGMTVKDSGWKTTLIVFGISFLLTGILAVGCYLIGIP